MTRVFLTGATGVLGRRVVPRLLAAGHEVTAVARSPEKAHALRRQGAAAVGVDLFDAAAVKEAVGGHDAVAHLATNIPTGAGAAVKRGWRTNDRLRTEAAANLSLAALATGAERYIQESITFPYVDSGSDWITEATECTYFWGNASTVDAEAAAAAVTAQGGSGVVLRFAMFMAADSAHMRTFATMAKRGRWGLFGPDDAFASFIHIDDAATAVVAALDIGAGTYNVAEAGPSRRGDHRAALAAAMGREALKSLPRVVERAAGDSAESLARSQRVSSSKLTDASGWRATHDLIDCWGELA